MTSICVYCGSSSLVAGHYVEAARLTGEAIAARGLALVYGGARVGLMGIVADAVLARGGRVTGVIPRALVDKEVAHPGLTVQHVVESMHDRKALMAELAGGFLALPGGFGTLDELFEMLTWAQLGFHAKPIGLLNTAGYFDGLLEFCDRAVRDGFVRESHRQTIRTGLDAGELIGRMAGPELGR